MLPPAGPGQPVFTYALQPGDTGRQTCPPDGAVASRLRAAFGGGCRQRSGAQSAGSGHTMWPGSGVATVPRSGCSVSRAHEPSRLCAMPPPPAAVCGYRQLRVPPPAHRRRLSVPCCPLPPPPPPVYHLTTPTLRRRRSVDAFWLTEVGHCRSAGVSSERQAHRDNSAHQHPVYRTALSSDVSNKSLLLKFPFSLWSNSSQNLVKLSVLLNFSNVL